jgi:hypothetical protein
MKAIVFAAFAAILFISAGSLRAEAPDLETGVLIKDGSSNLSVNYHSSACVVDWNNDGRKDLVVGQFYYGYIWLFLNTGTDINPLFNGGTLINSNGSPITTTYG